MIGHDLNPLFISMKVLIKHVHSICWVYVCSFTFRYNSMCGLQSLRLQVEPSRALPVDTNLLDCCIRSPFRRRSKGQTFDWRQALEVRCRAQTRMPGCTSSFLQHVLGSKRVYLDSPWHNSHDMVDQSTMPGISELDPAMDQLELGDPHRPIRPEEGLLQTTWTYGTRATPRLESIWHLNSSATSRMDQKLNKDALRGWRR